MGCLKLPHQKTNFRLNVVYQKTAQNSHKKVFPDGTRFYSYGFNGMERDDEINGKGNNYTAEYWQYDSRLGRRWNLDPVIAPWESPYAAFRNNPIFHDDPNGDCPDCEDNTEPSTHTIQKGETLSGIAKNTGTSVEELTKWNKIEDPNKIYAGNTIFTSNPNASPNAQTASGSSSNEGQTNESSQIPLASLGLTITGSGAEATLLIKDYAKLNAALKEGKFITNYNGTEKIWSMNFFGNKSVSSSSVTAGKASFTKTTSTLKVVKGLGVVASIGGAGISIYQYSQGETSGAKLTADLVMTGVAFVPGVGWVVSGAYFVIDATVGWKETISIINRGLSSFERLDEEHRRVTGRGILQGPKY